jgi:hypothetical protein
MSPSTTVVICGYTRARRDRLVEAVESVCRQEPEPAEVLVVVDHNDDLLVELADCLRDHHSPDIRVLPSVGARGLSGARNTGTAAARCEVVAFLDDDATAEPGWLAELVAPYADPLVVAVGGRVDPVWEAPRPRWFPDEFGWVVGCSYRGQPTTLAPVRNPIGANMSFRRGPLLDAGGFNEGIGRSGADARGCEETEAAIRVQAAVPGARVLLQPTARVRHHVPGERTSWRYFWRRCWAEGGSKAAVARLVGPQRALAAERRYVRRVLPTAIGRAAVTAWRNRDPTRAMAAAAVTAATLVTAAGYLTAMVRARAEEVLHGQV